MHEPRTLAQSDFEEEAPLCWSRTRHVHQRSSSQAPSPPRRSDGTSSSRSQHHRSWRAHTRSRHRTCRAPRVAAAPLVGRIRRASRFFSSRQSQQDYNQRPDPLAPWASRRPCAFLMNVETSISKKGQADSLVPFAEQTQRLHVAVKDVDGRETASCRAGGRWFHRLTCRSCGRDMGSPRRAALVCLPDSPPGRQARHPRSAGSHRGKPGTRRHRRGPCWRIGLTRPSPVVRKDDDEHRIICDGSRTRGSFWQ